MSARRLHDLEDAAAQACRERDEAKSEAHMAADSTIRAELVVEELAKEIERLKAEQRELHSGLHAVIKTVTAERDEARAEAEGGRAEVEEARAQVLLDAEDRVVVRALLRTARKQAAKPEQVVVLFKDGTVHSLHTSRDAAEAAAEEEGVARDGWVNPLGSGMPPVLETGWCIRTFRLGGDE
ncbi:hypothetical protein ACFC8F_23135 [Streptomyces hydrogenans]|uniref:hypothetical protein n=1 Tax=Streptomyces hydrogenans TaxID=1873719 RepID=UPI0035E34760